MQRTKKEKKTATRKINQYWSLTRINNKKRARKLYRLFYFYGKNKTIQGRQVITGTISNTY